MPSVALVVTTVPVVGCSAASHSAKAGFHALTVGFVHSVAAVPLTSDAPDPTSPGSVPAFPCQARSADSQVRFATPPFQVQAPQRVADYYSASA